MTVVSLVYHDVIEDGQFNSSGFCTSNAAGYKLDVSEFESHLKAVQSALKGPVVTANQLMNIEGKEPVTLFTFDDGGRSAYTHLAGMLENYGWKGHFFVTTDMIGTPSFLSIGEIRELSDRGHVIGSHTCSHPTRMSYCSHEKLLDEWGRSVRTLSEIVKKPVNIASVPGGFFSKEVAETAAESGIDVLFTSEPVSSVYKIENCLIVGRYSVKRGMPASVPAEYVSRKLSRRIRNYLFWNFKKILKKLGGRMYLRFRSAVLARRHSD